MPDNVALASSLERDLLERYREPGSEDMVEGTLNQTGILEDDGFFVFDFTVRLNANDGAPAPGNDVPEPARSWR